MEVRQFDDIFEDIRAQMITSLTAAQKAGLEPIPAWDFERLKLYFKIVFFQGEQNGLAIGHRIVNEEFEKARGVITENL